MIPSKKILRFLTSTLASVMMMLTLLSPASSAVALGATNNRMPIDAIRSADCTGEDVEISGTIHLLSQTQADGSEVIHFNYQNVRGLGLTSGTIYQVSAVDQARLSAPFPSSIQSVQSFHLISRGAASNLTVQVLYHITVNADGEVTASIDELSMQCT